MSTNENIFAGMPQFWSTTHVGITHNDINPLKMIDAMKHMPEHELAWHGLLEIMYEYFVRSRSVHEPDHPRTSARGGQHDQPL
jgi:hypothetical protein